MLCFTGLSSVDFTPACISRRQRKTCGIRISLTTNARNVFKTFSRATYSRLVRYLLAEIHALFWLSAAICPLLAALTKASQEAQWWMFHVRLVCKEWVWAAEVFNCQHTAEIKSQVHTECTIEKCWIYTQLRTKCPFFKQEEDTVNNYWLNKYEMVVRTVAVGLLKFHICKYLIYFVFKQVFRLSIFICTCLRCLYWWQIFLLRHVCFYCCFQSGNVVFHCLLKWKHYLDKYGLFYLKHFQTHFYIGINPQRAVSWT